MARKISGMPKQVFSDKIVLMDLFLGGLACGLN